MQEIAAFLTPVIVYAYIFGLNVLLPGRWVTGYVTKPNSSEKLRYRLNGLQVLFTVIGTWAALCYFELVPWQWLYITRWYGAAGAITFGLVFSFAIVLPYPSVRKSTFADLFFGRLENPQLYGGKVDAKMWLYLIGATMLALNVLSFSAFHYLKFGAAANPGIYLSTGLLMYFIIDYLTFEEVHLYTYDFFAERVGFKLGWGCIAFYPYFYSVPMWTTADLPDPQTPTWLLIVYALIFFTGWTLARGANMQKYYFKRDPKRKFLGITPETITDGNRTLLVNGYWGLSRHINYLGEITMATGIVLATGHADQLWPWLYPLYYVALLFPRQMDDDKRCAAKYGPLWQEYTKRVRYRIIPFIY